VTRVALAALVAFVMSVLTAGAVIASGGDAEGPVRSLSVELDEWRITPSAERVGAGALTLGQTNTGAQEHELLIVRTDLAADDLPMGLEGVSPATAGEVVYGKQHSHHTGTKARGRHLQPRDTKRDRIRLKPGRYVLLCSIPGHYEAGQRAALRVG
jgi:uncharacterized cupredoxin-like copper-binding protein